MEAKLIQLNFVFNCRLLKIIFVLKTVKVYMLYYKYNSAYIG